ncbi:MAG: PEP-CTERM sorting domain-containing protein [Acidobacteria bacterium]|nr:PEP-CTERM sorting domain-containing protein [Acidobacteriota bacterium]
MRSLLCVLIGLCMAAVAGATPFPTNYFYDCAQVNCAAFIHHDYSLLPNVLPLGGSPSLDAQWQNNTTVAGNHSGQAIGCGFYGTGCGSVYGEGGVAYLVSGGPDLPVLQGDINENGFWVLTAYIDPFIYWHLYGNGSSVGGGGANGLITTTQGIMLMIRSVLAINEAGDVYLDGLIYDNSPTAPTGAQPSAQPLAVRGVLTNTQIPEPATISLLVGGCVLLLGRKLSQGR